MSHIIISLHFGAAVREGNGGGTVPGTRIEGNEKEKCQKSEYVNQCNTSYTVQWTKLRNKVQSVNENKAEAIKL